MKRRTFNALLPGMVLGSLNVSPFSLKNKTGQATVKPERLKKGDTVGLITPGSYAPPAAVQKSISNLQNLGLKVQMGRYLTAKRGYNAGTDEQRLEDLHRMFANPQIKAIWCVRGGYGCTRLLPMIDYELIKNNPKILIGFSDITALSNAIYQQTGLVGFHGPLGSSTIDEYSARHIRAVLFEGVNEHPIDLQGHPNAKNKNNYSSKTFQAGVASGILAGGNLSVLVAMAGTPYAFKADNTLLFLEDVGEKPYRIDRMLTQLRQSTSMSQINGIVLGIFHDCEPDPEDESLRLSETLQDRLGHLDKPVQYGYPFGHIKHQCVLPIGIRARLDSDEQQLIVLENAVR